MAEQMGQQEKVWSSNFVLDGAKLTRIHGEIMQRLRQLDGDVVFQFGCRGICQKRERETR